MEKVSIIYSIEDKQFVDKLKEKFKENNINVLDTIEIFSNFKEKFEKMCKEEIPHAGESIEYEARYWEDERSKMPNIVIISAKSINSEAFNFELSQLKINEITQEKRIIIPLLIEDCEVPFGLMSYPYLDFRDPKLYDHGYNQLISLIKDNNKSNDVILDLDQVEIQKRTIEPLRKAYDDNKLVLFCGAGISAKAGIPSWSSLLEFLLKNTFDKESVDAKLLVKHLQNNIKLPSLIIGKYLKLLLKEDFEGKVRDALYFNCKDSSDVIDAIAELSRPKRNRHSLKAIITFNFDDLIEENLRREKIDYKPIFTEGERCEKNEIPIYHPHGYLPRKIRLTKDNEIVFSEDAYHSQFIDPFSWTNLIQLNHLNNSVCLFIGISLTDPNMRRLLDVSYRKNGKKEINHYIIKKRNIIDNYYSNKELSEMSDSKKEAINKVIETNAIIEEQDAIALGLNVIWISDFGELPDILKEIGK